MGLCLSSFFWLCKHWNGKSVTTCIQQHIRLPLLVNRETNYVRFPDFVPLFVVWKKVRCHCSKGLAFLHIEWQRMDWTGTASSIQFELCIFPHSCEFKLDTNLHEMCRSVERGFALYACKATLFQWIFWKGNYTYIRERSMNSNAAWRSVCVCIIMHITHSIRFTATLWMWNDLNSSLRLILLHCSNWLCELSNAKLESITNRMVRKARMYIGLDQSMVLLMSTAKAS